MNKNNNNGKHVTAAGTKIWYQDGKKHRLDGPAVIRSCGIIEYWIRGHQVTEGFLSRRKRGED